MSKEHHVNFNDLLNLTFNNGSVNIKHLQLLFKILVAQLKLDDVEVFFSDQNLLSKEYDDIQVTENEKEDVKMDPVITTISKPENLAEVLSQEESSNPLTDMSDLLKITERVEAVEISTKKLTTLIETLLKTEKSNEMKSEEFLEDSLISNSPSKKESTTVSLSKHSQSSPITQKSSSASSKCDQYFIDFKDMVEKQIAQIDATSFNASEKLSKLTKNVCDIQKTMMTLQETIDDLMYTCERNDLKSDDTAWEIKDFNSKIFCLKSDVTKLLNNSKEFKLKLVEVDTKYETMNNIKTNKSYVDELWNQKAFKSDLELMLRRDEFDDMTDILRLKFSLLNEHFEKLQENTKKSLACFKSKVDEKLEKQELMKFKDTTTNLFDEFTKELKTLLCELTKNPLDPNLNCILCDSKISMMKKAKDIPQLSAITQRFKLNMNKIPIKSAKDTSNEDFRQIFCKETKPAKVNVPSCAQKNLLNFPHSHGCFIIAKDNTIFKADPMKCLNNPRYMKS